MSALQPSRARRQVRNMKRRPLIASRLVAIVASRGGVAALRALLAALPASFPAAVIIVLHHAPPTAGRKDPIVAVLQAGCALPVRTAWIGTQPMRGHVYVAPADMHLVLTEGRRFALADGRRIRGVRSSANPLFESAACAYGDRLVAVVLTGGDRDGTDGVQSVTHAGGTVIAQDPATARDPHMPTSAIATGAVAHVLPLAEIGPTLIDLVA
jgi:two-component system, chemotaxis family, protein-glutamate methylesterase/glutaminase